MFRFRYFNPLAVVISAFLDKGYAIVYGLCSLAQLDAECQNVGRCANV